ncbi:MAG: fumarylacetoacetate hydrolase family protein [Desulfitobacteriia bacterium]|jgi:2-keto-4-pentenoate hydratase/2-oxohepta-3-ene-1,7-dioic acid hydratase in catechol pathway
MRFTRFLPPGQTSQYGLVEEDIVKAVKGDIFSNYELSGEQFSINEVRFLAPVKPSKVLCIGLNYSDHAQELGLSVPEEPVLFMKPPTAVIGTDENIVYPTQSQNLHYEAELAIVIGKLAKNIKKGNAFNYIFGYTCSNDVTARDLQAKDGQWSRAKGFDTFCPLGPWIETEIRDPDNLEIKLMLNGKVRQHSNTKMLFFKCAELVEYLSSIMTLLPGDIILTGTPAGIGPMQPGDKVEVDIEGIGTLVNRVVK